MTIHHSTRPKESDAEIRLAAARVLATRMGDDCDTPDAHDAIASVLDASSAYEMAKKLDWRHGWIVDDNILEVLLEGAYFAVQTALREAVADWVQSNAIKPRNAVGDSVAFAYRGATIDGVVTGINETEAKYTVNSPQLGHVPAGTNGVNGIIVPYEHVHSLFESAEEFTLRAQTAVEAG